jgi:predicted nucleic acid-binding protein
MTAAPEVRTAIVVDTCCLINFLVLDRMDILQGLGSDFVFFIPNHVTAEVIDSMQRDRLDAALTAHIVTEIAITDPAEVELYANLRALRVLGDGECASLAVAACRRCAMATDEKGRLRREIIDRLGEDAYVNTAGILVAAMRAGLLTPAEGEEIRLALAAHRFVMDVPPFIELLENDNPE